MDRFGAMQVFVAVAETGSFAGAARRLGQSPPAVTRAVAAIEQRIGIPLLLRTTRSVRLTEAGARYLGDCRRILADIEEAEWAAAGAHAEPRGQIAITAPVMFGRMHVAPVVDAFLDRHPLVTARLVLLDRVTDLMEEGFHVAVRIAELGDSGLHAQRVGSVRPVICATPTYLERHGEPRQPEDIAAHTAIISSPQATLREWGLLRDGREVRIVPSAQLQVNAADVAIEAVLNDRGLTRLLSYQVAPLVRAGRLRIILADYEPPQIPVHLVHLEGRRVSARVRAFIDFAAGYLRNDLNTVEKSLY